MGIALESSRHPLKMAKGELLKDALQQQRQPGLGDARRGQHNFPQRELIDGVDVIDPLALGAAALMYRIDPQKGGLAFGRELFAFAKLHCRGPRFLIHAQTVAQAAAQVVKMAVGEPG